MELAKLDAWRPLLAEELKKPYFAALAERVDAAYETQTVFPPRDELFTAFARPPPAAQCLQELREHLLALGNVQVYL